MNLTTPLVQELATEAATTRRVLDRVPESSLGWRPHAKSMSLGQLALHVATLPRMVSDFVVGDTLDFSVAAVPSPTIATHAALMAAFDDSIAHAQGYLMSLSDVRAMEAWTLLSGQAALFSAPRVGVLRSFLFNHWYHHRGQLVVYLRLLDVPVPSVYGPTADENPFGAAPWSQWPAARRCDVPRENVARPSGVNARPKMAAQTRAASRDGTNAPDVLRQRRLPKACCRSVHAGPRVWPGRAARRLHVR